MNALVIPSFRHKLNYHIPKKGARVYTHFYFSCPTFDKSQPATIKYSMTPETVYTAVKQIPRGRVTTYGAIARACNCPTNSRQVGKILHTNPTPIVVPCHRVVFSNGALSPNFGFGTHGTQRKLLESEGVTFTNNRVNRQHFHNFS